MELGELISLEQEFSIFVPWFRIKVFRTDHTGSLELSQQDLQLWSVKINGNTKFYSMAHWPLNRPDLQFGSIKINGNIGIN